MCPSSEGIRRLSPGFLEWASIIRGCVGLKSNQDPKFRSRSKADVCGTSTRGDPIVITDKNKVVDDLCSRVVVRDNEFVLIVFKEFHLKITLIRMKIKISELTHHVCKFKWDGYHDAHTSRGEIGANLDIS